MSARRGNRQGGHEAPGAPESFLRSSRSKKRSLDGSGMGSAKMPDLSTKVMVERQPSVCTRLVWRMSVSADPRRIEKKRLSTMLCGVTMTVSAAGERQKGKERGARKKHKEYVNRSVRKKRRVRQP